MHRVKHTLRLRRAFPLLFVLGGSTLAEPRHHGAHEHGTVKLNLAVEGKEALLEIRAPAESIFGFEHKPGSEEQKKTVKEQSRTLTNQADQIVVFDKKLKCRTSIKEFSAFAMDDHEDRRQKTKQHVAEHNHETKHSHGKNEKMEHHTAQHHGHSEMHATYKVSCQAPITGTRIGFGLMKLFPRIKRIDVQAISETKQIGVQLTNGNETIEI